MKKKEDLFLLRCLIFSEASKKLEDFIKDSIAICWVIKNRLGNPKRFGKNIKEVIFKPYQFSGVGTKEWDKASKGEFVSGMEKLLADIGETIARSVFEGVIPDNTKGADHYFNPKLVLPEWSQEMIKTYTSGAHDYYKS